MNVVLLVIAFVMIVVYEIPDIIRSRRLGELAVFLGLVLFAFTISLLQTIGVPVPNPIKGIEFLTAKAIQLFQ